MKNNKQKIINTICQKYILDLPPCLYLKYTLLANVREDWSRYIKKNKHFLFLRTVTFMYNYYIYLSYVELED